MPPSLRLACVSWASHKRPRNRSLSRSAYLVALQTYPATVRTAYHEELTALTEQLGHTCGLAGVAMERATQALLGADLRWPNRSSPTTTKSPR